MNKVMKKDSSNPVDNGNTVNNNKKISKKNIHPSLFSYKIYLPDGTFFETVTAKHNEKFKENFFRLEIMQNDHPAWTGNIFGKVFNNKKNARTKNSGLDYNSFI